MTLSMIEPAQIRAARALLGWSQADLAKRCGLSADGIRAIEAGRRDARVSTIRAMQEAFELAGVLFLERNVNRDGGPGVRMR